MEITANNKRNAWLLAIRLRTLPLALSSILMGSFLAAFQNAFRFEILLMAGLTTVFLQILSNLANDYGDTIHGADSPDRQGPTRAVQSGVISLVEMKKAVLLFAILSLMSGTGLLFVALKDWKLFLVFMGIGIASIIAAITYTSGKKPYGYAGLGDLSVFLFFGLVGVMGTYFLHTLSVDWSILLPAISLGLFSTTVLNINNIRDIASDVKAGKKSIPVRIGKKKAIIYNWFLILTGNFVLVLFVFTQQAWWAFLPLVVFPFMIQIGIGVGKSTAIDPYLKKMAIATLFWVISFGLGLLLFS